MPRDGSPTSPGTNRTHRRSGVPSIVDAALERRARRRDMPQPWVTRKLAVAVTAAIMVYTLYVVIGRVTVPAIRGDAKRLVGRATGIGLLVGYLILWLMMAWSYVKIVLTPPGYAVEFCEKVSITETHPSTPLDRDVEAAQRPRRPITSRNGGLMFDDTLGVPYSAMPNPKSEKGAENGERNSQRAAEATRPRKPSLPREASSSNAAQFRPPAPASSTRKSDAFASPHYERQRSGSSSNADRRSEDAMRPRMEEVWTKTNGNGDVGGPDGPGAAGKSISSNANPPSGRQPLNLPLLRPEYRYCRRCQIVRPPRAHHCRSCGTCVLKYDHHCPWIGQCVGARNHRFFLIFVFWAGLYCLFVLSSLIGVNVVGSRRTGYDVDPQHIVAIAFAGLFTMFTVSIYAMHIVLVLSNMTTVEQISFRSERERDNEKLSEMFRWWQVGKKRRMRMEWDDEWGRIGREGNVWWLGSKRIHWELVMGRNPWIWFLPIGRSVSDGSTFERNPRFDSDGTWLPRKSWPKSLR